MPHLATKLRLFLLCFSLIVLQGFSQTSYAQTSLWKVENASQPFYLMGSIHIAKKSDYPLPQAMLDAFEQVDNIAVEVNVLQLNQAQAMMAMMEHGMIKNGKTLKDVISTSNYNQLQKVLTATPVPFAEKMQPWAIAQVLFISEAKKMGYDEQLGIDQFFLRKATRLGKPIYELESAATQFQLFESFAELDQNKLMTDTLKMVPNVQTMLTDMMGAWRAGDVDKLTDMSMAQYGQSAAEQRLLKRLLDDRNVQMANKIESYLNGKKSVLVIVGAAHYPGRQGILTLLQQRGYKIKQL